MEFENAAETFKPKFFHEENHIVVICLGAFVCGWMQRTKIE
jgi:hypothetical protein